MGSTLDEQAFALLAEIAGSRGSTAAVRAEQLAAALARAPQLVTFAIVAADDGTTLGEVARMGTSASVSAAVRRSLRRAQTGNGTETFLSVPVALAESPRPIVAFGVGAHLGAARVVFLGLPGSGVSGAAHRAVAFALDAALDNALLLERADGTPRTPAEQEVQELQADFERRVAARTEELTAAVHELDAFAYSVSHDLRAPLRAIDAYGEILEENLADKLSPPDAQLLRRLRGAAARMRAIIDDLLALSQAGRDPLEFAEVDLAVLSATIIDELRRREPERVVEFLGADQAMVRADPRYLRLVLENLLGNAWKFTRKRDVALITLDTEESDENLRVLIHDNGAGFDPAHQSLLFEPFRRLHRMDEFEGTGIGLGLVKRIVGRHGGTVGAEGWPGQGATFWFELPRSG
ncbi:MAG: ATP-binding protein [Myxococcota bacterium]